MTGSERRDAIIKQIRESRTPVPGKSLAASYDVSRQVIVQDIALIRAAGYDIMATNRGYIINEPATLPQFHGSLDLVRCPITNNENATGCPCPIKFDVRYYGDGSRGGIGGDYKGHSDEEHHADYPFSQNSHPLSPFI